MKSMYLKLLEIKMFNRYKKFYNFTFINYVVYQRYQCFIVNVMNYYCIILQHHQNVNNGLEASNFVNSRSITNFSLNDMKYQICHVIVFIYYCQRKRNLFMQDKKTNKIKSYC